MRCQRFGNAERAIAAALLIAIGLAAVLAGCSGPRGGGAPCAGCEIGVASWYGRAHQGMRTASGERFDRDGLTAAHPALPFGTRVRVVNLANDRAVIVRITDRGPHDGRAIDLSEAAAREIGMIASGTARVRIEPL